MNNIILGRNIYRARRDKGLSSDKLSELCNVTPSYLRQVEAGSKTPSLPLFVELCNQLGVSPSVLMAGVVSDELDSNYDDLIRLCHAAKPSQIKLIHALIEAAINSIGETIS